MIKSKAIFTAAGDQLLDGFVAVSGKRIVAVEGRESMHRWLSAHTEVLDYRDGLVMPGFCDSHAHLFLGALALSSVNVKGAQSEEEAAAMVYAANRKAGSAWLFGFGWSLYDWQRKDPPTRRTLDRFFPETPVMVFDDELHAAWVNSEALRVCALDEKTPDPPGGSITRGADNYPSGHLLEPAAIKLVLDHAFQASPEAEATAVKSYFKETASLGITSISDIQLYDIFKHEGFKELERAGELDLRIHLVAPAREDLDQLMQWRRTYNTAMLRFSGVKEFLDGTAMAHTGLLLEPYADRPGYRGYPLLDVDEFQSRAILLDRQGFRIRLHACGDGAVRLALDILERVGSKNGARDARHTVEHIENIHPDDLSRFKSLGVVASVQPEHSGAESYAGHPFHEVLGAERTGLIWPCKSLLRHGAALAFGSDNPVVGLNPMQGVYRAVTRLMDDGLPEGGWPAGEKLSVAAALKAYTAGSAYQMFREHELGTLETGKFADITVLDRNIFETSIRELPLVKPVLTILDGRIIYPFN